MSGDAELMTGDPRWQNFLPGTSSLGLFFTGVEASGAHSRDVVVYGGVYIWVLLVLSWMERGLIHRGWGLIQGEDYFRSYTV